MSLGTSNIMTTQEKAHISPILQAIANSRALNLRALKLDLYYIPKFKGTNKTLVHDIELTQTFYQLSHSDARDSYPTIGSGALIELYVDHRILVIPNDSSAYIYTYHIVIPYNEQYKIVIGL